MCRDLLVLTQNEAQEKYQCAVPGQWKRYSSCVCPIIAELDNSALNIYHYTVPYSVSGGDNIIYPIVSNSTLWLD